MSEKSLFIGHINSLFQTSTQPPSSLMLLLPTQFQQLNCLLLLEGKHFICFGFVKIICKQMHTSAQVSKVSKCWEFHSVRPFFISYLYVFTNKICGENDIYINNANSYRFLPFPQTRMFSSTSPTTNHLGSTVLLHAVVLPLQKGQQELS